MRDLHADMGGCAQAAAGMIRCAIRMGVRHLHDTSDHHKEYAQHGDERSPRTGCIRFVVVVAHSLDYSVPASGTALPMLRLRSLIDATCDWKLRLVFWLGPR